MLIILSKVIFTEPWIFLLDILIGILSKVQLE